MEKKELRELRVMLIKSLQKMSDLFIIVAFNFILFV